jgi:hypothetical protein
MQIRRGRQNAAALAAERRRRPHRGIILIIVGTSDIEGTAANVAGALRQSNDPARRLPRPTPAVAAVIQCPPLAPLLLLLAAHPQQENHDALTVITAAITAAHRTKRTEIRSAVPATLGITTTA